MPQTRTDRSSALAARELVAAISRLRRRLRTVADMDELTPSQTSVLSLIAKADAAGAATTASTLAAAEGVRPQSIAASLQALDEQGLVARRSDPADGRRQLLSLTDQGAAMIADGRAARHEWLVERVSTTLTAAERQTIIDAAQIMQRLADA